MNYRTEITGLRSIAVVAVLFFHASIPGFQGGFLGVDMFFVISGFLVGGVVLADVKQNRLILLEFFVKRVRRIFPALLVMLLTTFFYAWLFLPPEGMKLVSEGVGTSSLFLSNLYYMTTMGYFGPDAKTTFLLHTWSLSVEEQFYLIFPILSLLSFRLFRFEIDKVFILIAFISFLSWIILSQNYASEVFYFSPARAWQFLLGAIAANVTRKPNLYWAWLGTALTLTSFALVQYSIGFSELSTLITSIGTSLILVYADKKNGIGKMLSCKPFVWVGVISYSLYLWHQPIFAHFRLSAGSTFSALTILTMLTVTVLIALVSYLLVERPFRHTFMKQAGRLNVLTVYSAPLVLLFLISLFGHFTDGFISRFPKEVVQATAIQSERSPYRDDCNHSKLRPTPSHPIAKCLFKAATEQGSVMVIGDSHADALGAALIPQLKASGFTGYLTTAGACLPVPIGAITRQSKSRASDCAAFMRSAFNFAIKSQQDYVVLTGRWMIYLREDKEIWSKILEQEITNLAEHTQVILIDPVPEMNQDVPDVLISSILNKRKVDEIFISLGSYMDRNESILSVFDEFKSQNIHRLNTVEIFCNDQIARCFGFDGQNILYRDDNHLSLTGTRMLASAIMKIIK